MRIKSLAQGENILMLRIEPPTFVSKFDILTTTPIVHDNAVCLNNASSFFVIDLCEFFLFSCFVFVYFIFFIYIMHSAFNLFVFPNYMFTSLLLFFCVFCVYVCFFLMFFYERAMRSPEQ